jgi:hypothetical protein
MSWPSDSFSPPWVGESTISAIPFVRGYQYLTAVRQLALEPEMLDVTDDLREMSAFIHGLAVTSMPSMLNSIPI